MYTFKLIAGMHDQGDGRVYKRGDTVFSEKELDRLQGSNRFLRLADTNAPVVAPPVPVREVEDEFGGMTVAELKKFAEEEEIDLDGATKKEIILAVIRKAVSDL